MTEIPLSLPAVGERFQASYEFYCKIADHLGHAPINGSKDPLEQRAAGWAAMCRARRAGTHPSPLPAAQAAMLEQAPFWYWTASRADRFQLAMDHYYFQATALGHRPREKGLGVTSEERKAARWAGSVRQVREGHRRGALTKERIVQLEALPYWFW